VEISGADPQYETPNATANQDYERDGKSYKIVRIRLTSPGRLRSHL
jgi:rare lipoprotein A